MERTSEGARLMNKNEGKGARGASRLHAELGAARLRNDIARCNGVGFEDEGTDGVWIWREGCDNCLRRTAPRPEICVMMGPPPIIAFECEYLIEAPNA